VPTIDFHLERSRWKINELPFVATVFRAVVNRFASGRLAFLWGVECLRRSPAGGAPG
jgi:hypothetical protein